jgi:hypothetical protein
MNINFTTFFLQCAAMGLWVFMAAGLVAIGERLIDKYFPGFLDIEAAGASQSPGPVIEDATKKA